VTSLIPVDALVLDYGEVLCEPASDGAMVAMAGETGIEPARFRELYWRLREDYDRGTLDGPAYWTRLAAEAGVVLSADGMSRLIALDVDAWTRVDARMFEWVNEQLAGGMKVSLLSNMVLEIKRQLLELGLFGAFTNVTFSCDVGSVKPEPAIYRHLLAKLGVSPERVLLIDDRPANIAGAGAVGMRGIVFRGFDALIADLRSFDLNLATRRSHTSTDSRRG
jgi:putative hydrolase of the HAD superfamily